MVLAEATWYGRIDVNWKNAPSGATTATDKSKSYSGLVDNGSRWGVKGSNELDDGLTAVYQFEAGIKAASDATQSGRLAYAGLSGGFGTLVAGKISAAAYGHAGAMVNNGYALGGSWLGSKLESGVSYATSVGSVNFQVDVQGKKTTGMSKKDENMHEDKNIDSSQFGTTLQLGENGKIALSHVNGDAKAKESNSSTLVVGAYSISGMTMHLGMGHQKWSSSASAPDAGSDTGQLADGMSQNKNTKVKTVFYGAAGSLGDTGVGYFLEFQNHRTSGKKFMNNDGTVSQMNVDKDKHTSWTVGLSRSLGTGTAVYLEHSEPDQEKTKATTVMGLQVNF